MNEKENEQKNEQKNDWNWGAPQQEWTDDDYEEYMAMLAMSNDPPGPEHID